MYLRIGLALLFLVFACVQLNDPDPWSWVLLYGLTALAFLISVKRNLPKRILQAGLLGIGIAMLLLLPDFVNWVEMGMPTITASMKAEAPHIELTREFLGLLITATAWYWLLKQK